MDEPTYTKRLVEMAEPLAAIQREREMQAILAVYGPNECTIRVSEPLQLQRIIPVRQAP